MARARGLVIVGTALGMLWGAGPTRASTSSAGAVATPKTSDCHEDARGVDPLAELRQSDFALSAALKRRMPDWSPEAPIYAARIDHLLAEILDYESIARQALGAHWDTLSADQRARFLAVFSPLTNSALLSAAERRVSVSYDSESVSGPEATVVVTPRFVDVDRSVDHSVDRAGGLATRIEYKLGERCGRWRIHDVLVDGVSLVDSYRAQFDRLFRKGTFDDVLAIMRHKLGRTQRAP